MAVAASHGADSRQQVQFNGAKIANLYSRRLSDGTTKYEYSRKIAGRIRKVTLQATSARQAIAEIESLRPLARQGGLSQGSTRLGDLFEGFLREAEAGTYLLESGRYADSTISNYRQMARDHILDTLGESTRIRDVSQGDVQALVDRLRSKLSGSTCRGVVSAISAAFTYGRRRGLVQHDPTRGLLMPSAQRRSEPRYLSRAEADALLAELTREMRPIVAVMLFAGCRVSEALGLCWGDVDLAAGTLHVHRQLGRDGASFAPLKTSSSAAVLSIPEPLLVILREHRARMAALGFERVAGDRLVFQTASGRSPGRNNVTRAVRVVSKRLGFGQVGAHDCRHSCAGMLRSLGIPSEEIALYLRHASVRTTIAVYGGWADEDRAKVRAEAAAALS